jgi:hypothetical protein
MVWRMRRRLSLLPAAVVALIALVAAAALAAAPPTADTQPAKDVAQTSATLVAQVNPEGQSTTVHFELGTSTGYGLQSAQKDVGSSTTPASVEIGVDGLTSGTTYHYRAVATNASGTVHGGDATFTTTTPAPTPSKPSVGTGGVRDVDLYNATVLGSVNPHAAATTYHFDWGMTKSYGHSTPNGDAGSGTKTIGVAAHLGGLEPGKRYHYRLVASNSRGTSRGGDHTFVTASTPTGATLGADRDPVPYGQGVTLKGKLSGTRISSVRVRLQTTAFPFDSPFADVLSPVKSSRSGSYQFKLPAITVTTRALVIADGTPPVLSKIVVIKSRARTGITSVRRTGRRVVIGGRITPTTPNGVAALQRQGAGGRWLPLKRAHVRSDGRYFVGIRARRKQMAVRVVGLTHDRGAHVRGFSRTVVLAGRA